MDKDFSLFMHLILLVGLTSSRYRPGHHVAKHDFRIYQEEKMLK